MNPPPFLMRVDGSIKTEHRFDFLSSNPAYLKGFLTIANLRIQGIGILIIIMGVTEKIRGIKRCGP